MIVTWSWVVRVKIMQSTAVQEMLGNRAQETCWWIVCKKWGKETNQE